MNSAKEDEELVLANGTYTSAITISKSITLRALHPGKAILDGQNKYSCPKCKHLSKAVKQMLVSRLPNVLAIQLLNTLALWLPLRVPFARVDRDHLGRQRAVPASCHLGVTGACAALGL